MAALRPTHGRVLEGVSANPVLSGNTHASSRQRLTSPGAGIDSLPPSKGFKALLALQEQGDHQ